MGDLGAAMLDPGGGLAARDELKTQFMTREGTDDDDDDDDDSDDCNHDDYRDVSPDDTGRVHSTQPGGIRQPGRQQQRSR